MSSNSSSIPLVDNAILNNPYGEPRKDYQMVPTAGSTTAFLRLTALHTRRLDPA